MLYTLIHIGRVLLWGVLFFALYLLFFAHTYRFSTEALSVPQATALQETSPDLFSQSFRTHIGFLSATGGALQHYDAALVTKYALTPEIQARFTEHLPAAPFVFTLEQLDAYVHPEPAVDAFYKKALSQYGAWLVDKTYDSHESFAQDLALVAVSIRRYGIHPEKNLFPLWERDNLQANWVRAAAQGPLARSAGTVLALLMGTLLLATLLYLLPRYRLDGTPGIKHNGIFGDPMKTRGWIGWLTAVVLIVFYVVLYFSPTYLSPWVMLLDPFSVWLKGGPAGHFFLYGFVYCLAVGLMGIRMYIKYRHSAYHKLRTSSLIFFQLCIAFVLPEFLVRINKPYFDFKNIWPLDYDFFFDIEINKLIAGGGFGFFLLGWGICLALVAVPVLTYFFGKRWYCSWVCGCGALAETMGDPYRHLSNKSLWAWKIERWSVHLVLVFATVMTAAVLYTYWSSESSIFGVNSFGMRKAYGFYIGALFSGVIGTGFYPLMGSRVWCRFGCPLAAYLGLVQRFRSRFRITTNGGQCISCGNCTTYCEMGIDVRHYAQRGQAVVRSSCVGCGVCASVCPRGVLRLENQKGDRFEAKLLGLSEPLAEKA